MIWCKILYEIWKNLLGGTKQLGWGIPNHCDSASTKGRKRNFVARSVLFEFIAIWLSISFFLWTKILHREWMGRYDHSSRKRNLEQIAMQQFESIVKVIFDWRSIKEVLPWNCFSFIYQCVKWSSIFCIKDSSWWVSYQLVIWRGWANQLLTCCSVHGHIQSIMVRYTSPKQLCIKSDCIPEMSKDRVYKVIFLLLDLGTFNVIGVEHGCPAGKGPYAWCKHVGSLC